MTNPATTDSRTNKGSPRHFVAYSDKGDERAQKTQQGAIKHTRTLLYLLELYRAIGTAAIKQEILDKYQPEDEKWTPSN